MTNNNKKEQKQKGYLQNEIRGRSCHNSKQQNLEFKELLETFKEHLLGFFFPGRVHDQPVQRAGISNHITVALGDIQSKPIFKRHSIKSFLRTDMITEDYHGP